MKEEKPFNIFDAAGKQKKPTPKKAAPPKKEIPTPPIQKPAGNESLPSTATVEEMMKQMEKMRDDIRAKFEEVCSKGGVNPKQLGKFVEVFQSTEAYQTMEKARLELEDKINSAVGIVVKMSSKEKKVTEKMDKDRKGKTLGTRKKWIPMR